MAATATASDSPSDWLGHIMMKLDKFRRIGLFCDTELQSADGRHFYAQSSVLAAACPVLHQQFYKSKPGVYVVKVPLETTTLECILNYVYTGVWDLSVMGDIDLVELDRGVAIMGLQRIGSWRSPLMHGEKDDDNNRAAKRRPQRCLYGRPLCKKRKKADLEAEVLARAPPTTTTTCKTDNRSRPSLELSTSESGHSKKKKKRMTKAYTTSKVFHGMIDSDMSDSEETVCSGSYAKLKTRGSPPSDLRMVKHTSSPVNNELKSSMDRRQELPDSSGITSDYSLGSIAAADSCTSASAGKEATKAAAAKRVHREQKAPSNPKGNLGLQSDQHRHIKLTAPLRTSESSVGSENIPPYLTTDIGSSLHRDRSGELSGGDKKQASRKLFKFKKGSKLTIRREKKLTVQELPKPYRDGVAAAKTEKTTPPQNGRCRAKSLVKKQRAWDGKAAADFPDEKLTGSSKISRSVVVLKHVDKMYPHLVNDCAHTDSDDSGCPSGKNVHVNGSREKKVVLKMNRAGGIPRKRPTSKQVSCTILS